MTKGTRIFRIIISILLGLTMLWTAFISIAFFYTNNTETLRRTNERFGLFVAGVPVMFKNAADVLGDGTVIYNKTANTLILNNAVIEHDGPALYSTIDLTVQLNGENKIVCTAPETAAGIYASDALLRKDISFIGDGSLSIEAGSNTSTYTAGIVADDLLISADVTVALSDSEESSVGMECSYLGLLDEAEVTVTAGSAEKSTGIYVRGDMSLEKNTKLTVTGAIAAKDSFGIECTGIITAHEGASIDSVSGGERPGIVCYGTFADYGADINSEIDAVDGIRHEHKAAH